MDRRERDLVAVLERLDAPLDAAGPLAALLDLLEQPTAPTSVHDRRVALDVHVADSLAGLGVPELRSAELIADLGSGAGLPGLVLAATLPDAQVIAVEASSRKCAFLRSVVAAMGLSNVVVVHARAEEWEDGRERCDVVTARAVASLPVLFEYAAPLLRSGGVLVAWKGAVEPVEEGDGAAAAAHLGLTTEPVRAVAPYAGSERRTLHVARKTGTTPPTFPRRPGIAAKRPLSATSLR